MPLLTTDGSFPDEFVFSTSVETLTAHFFDGKPARFVHTGRNRKWVFVPLSFFYIIIQKPYIYRKS